ncbi:hypothetical protein OG883_38255 [Streptomyces sp. NBC_01142]|uniref:hypothetical protein n=1 Tax=Streptomyces sp. NBC_01142 TaxID=2975865 RepID=UPI002259A09B|nr:hypothetical protein [Streptomyces sp. NBC_01142]MCX4825596.1 hypothetical protein [Streptomyces sp. NBC_01142]
MAGPIVAVTAVLLPAALLVLVVALARYEEHLLTPRPARRHRRSRAARHARRRR